MKSKLKLVIIVLLILLIQCSIESYNNNSFAASDINKLTPIGNISNPINESFVKETIIINGWFLDITGVKKVEVLIDNITNGRAIYGIKRQDVYDIFPQYGNTHSGFIYYLNTKPLQDGVHYISIKETNFDGNITISSKRKITVANNFKGTLPYTTPILTLGYMDSPNNDRILNGPISVKGWFLDPNSVDKIEILVDNKVAGQAQYGYYRRDVYLVHPEYRNNNSGFEYILDTKTLIPGDHTVTAREISKTGSITTLPQRIITVSDSMTSIKNTILFKRGSIETPIDTSTTSGIINISGWFLDPSRVKNLILLVDYIPIPVEVEYGTRRPDIYTKFPQYGNTHSGFECILDTSNFSNGSHIITIRETGQDETTTILPGVEVILSN